MNPLDTSSSSSSSEDDEIAFRRRRAKVYRKRQNGLDKYDDIEFFQRFRLNKLTVIALLAKIEHLISSPTNRGGCIQPITQLLLTLRFNATGSMLISAGDFIGVSKTSACRIVRRVSAAIASLRPEYIKMPTRNAEMERAAEDFYRFARFPRVIGAIDCTLIRIQSPGDDDAEIFRSRKGYFALNVQTVSDAKTKIRNIVARWPGSSHDQTIFNNSRLKEQFVNGTYGRNMLIGDSGYTLEPYLMTKLQETQTPAEELYNESIIRTRNVVERQYGVWKRRFPVLSLGVRLKITTVMDVIVATAVLHNLAIDMNDIYPEDWIEDLDDEDDNENIMHDVGNNHANMGRITRRLLINEHFARL